MTNIHEIIAQARVENDHLVGTAEWHSSVEDRVCELAQNEAVADKTLEQLNNQLFRSAGII